MVSLDHLTPAECIRLEYYFRYKRLLKDGYCESPCNPKDLSNSQDISKMDEEEIILEEEKILSENVDANIMELIKTESAEMNIQIYVLSVISLGL